MSRGERAVCLPSASDSSTAGGENGISGDYGTNNTQSILQPGAQGSQAVMDPGARSAGLPQLGAPQKPRRNGARTGRSVPRQSLQRELTVYPYQTPRNGCEPLKGEEDRIHFAPLTLWPGHFHREACGNRAGNNRSHWGRPAGLARSGEAAAGVRGVEAEDLEL